MGLKLAPKEYCSIWSRITHSFEARHLKPYWYYVLLTKTCNCTSYWCPLFNGNKNIWSTILSTNAALGGTSKYKQLVLPICHVHWNCQVIHEPHYITKRKLPETCMQTGSGAKNQICSWKVPPHVRLRLWEKT